MGSEVKASQTPRSDLVRQAGVFLIEHAAHDITFEIPTGMTHGIFAACNTCCHAIHYPMMPATDEGGGD